MGFNNGLERIRLENQWKKLRVQYRAAGMSDEAIQAMYEFDFQVVNSEQTYYRHTVDLSISNTEAGDSRDTMVDKFSQVAGNVPVTNNDPNRRYTVINGYPVVLNFAKEPNPGVFERVRDILLATSYTKKTS